MRAKSCLAAAICLALPACTRGSEWSSDYQLHLRSVQLLGQDTFTQRRELSVVVEQPDTEPEIHHAGVIRDEELLTLDTLPPLQLETRVGVLIEAEGAPEGWGQVTIDQPLDLGSTEHEQGVLVAAVDAVGSLGELNNEETFTSALVAIPEGMCCSSTAPRWASRHPTRPVPASCASAPSTRGSGISSSWTRSSLASTT